MRWQTCMLPREMIWEEVAPPQYKGMIKRKELGVKVQIWWYLYDVWLVYVCSPMLVPRQLRFSLYSGAVITEGRCSLFTSLL